MTERVPRSFYARSAREVARDLLGITLVRNNSGIRVSGKIVETEAYCDTEERDLACHADRANEGRPTARTAVMFGPAGFCYVYFTYGMHWMLNIVTGSEGKAGAVLIRALEPIDGLEQMRRLRGRPDNELTNGPAKLTQALAIDGSHNSTDLCLLDSLIWLEYGSPRRADKISSGPRIGLGKTPEPWLSMPWRYWITDNRHVSR
ncbi:MAG: DNA-3-methyladenine glycosylase [Candidatus Promineifilaceae bacterium]